MFETTTKGQTITVNTAKGAFTGEFISVNSKGANLKIDGKVKSFALSKIESVTTPSDTGDYTTREVADMFDMEAKALRVQLRALGLGVGKGRKYGLNDSDVAKIREHLATTNA